MTCATSQFNKTCTVKRRKDTSINGGIGADKYDVLIENDPCGFIEKPGRIEAQGDSGRDLVSDGEFRTKTEVQETDMIVIDDNEWIILLVTPLVYRVTGITEYYRCLIKKRGRFTDALEQAEPRINLD